MGDGSSVTSPPFVESVVEMAEPAPEDLSLKKRETVVMLEFMLIRWCLSATGWQNGCKCRGRGDGRVAAGAARYHDIVRFIPQSSPLFWEVVF